MGEICWHDLQLRAHLLDLIEGILDLARMDSGRMALNLEDFDVAAIVRDVAAAVAPLAERSGNRVRTVCEPAVLHGDGGRVRQCLLSLARNACKFTQDGEVTIVVDAAGDGPWFLLQVIDTGIGIAEEDIARLFLHFTQVDGSRTRKYGGAGLGLAVSRRLCRLMGGDITVESEFGKGSTFTMRIPMRMETLDGRETAHTLVHAPVS